MYFDMSNRNEDKEVLEVIMLMQLSESLSVLSRYLVVNRKNTGKYSVDAILRSCCDYYSHASIHAVEKK